MTYASKAPSTRSRRAFTFIELIIVIIIIAILSTLAVVNFSRTFEDIQLQQFGKEVSYLAQYVHTTSIVRNKTYCLIISENTPVEISAAYFDESGIAHAMEGKFSKPVKAPASATLVSLEPAEKKDFYFYPDGSCDPLIIKFSAGNKSSLTLTLQQPTGTLQIDQ